MSIKQYNYNTVDKKLIKISRRACRNTPALIDFETLPEDIKQKCIAVFGEPPKREFVKIIEMEKFITYNKTAYEFFQKFKFDNGKELSDDKKIEYYTNAIVLDAMMKRHNEIKSIRKSIGASRTNIWAIIVNELQALKNIKNSTGEAKYPHTLALARLLLPER